MKRGRGGGVTLFLDKDIELEKTNFDQQDCSATAPPFGNFLYHDKGHF